MWLLRLLAAAGVLLCLSRAAQIRSDDALALVRAPPAASPAAHRPALPADPHPVRRRADPLAPAAAAAEAAAIQPELAEDWPAEIDFAAPLPQFARWQRMRARRSSSARAGASQAQPVSGLRRRDQNPCDNTLVCSPTDLWHALEQYRAHCPVPGCRYTTEANVFLLTQGNITLVCDADMNVQPPANNCAVTNVASNCLVMLSVTASYPYTETLVSWDSINLVQLTGDGWDPDHVAQVLKTPNADLYGVQLSNTGLSTLNIDTFSQLTNLCALGLGQNQLTTLPEGLFTATTNLQMLSLYGNPLRSLPQQTFAGLSKLEALDLIEVSITSLPEGILDPLVSLQELWLLYGSLQSFPPKFLWKAPNFTTLGASYNNISYLDKDLFLHSTALRYLSFTNNDISQLDEALFVTTTQLLQLDLSVNRLTRLPPGLLNRQTNLRTLVLFNNSLQEIPDLLLQNTPIVTLDMSNNAVAAITQTHVSAVQSTLTKVLLSNTGLKTLPQFSEFSKLSTLVVSSNNMGGELNFTAPPGLKLLDLGGNDYTSINLTLYHMLDFASVADNTRLSALVANATIPHIDISNTSIPFDNTTICTTIGTTQLAAHAMKHVTWKTNFFQALNYCLQHSESLDFEDVPQLPLWQVIAATNRWYTIGPAPPGFSFTSDEANLDMYYPARRLPELRLGRNFPVQCTTYLQPKTIYRVLVSDFVHFNVTFDVVAGATFSCGCVEGLTLSEGYCKVVPKLKFVQKPAGIAVVIIGALGAGGLLVLLVMAAKRRITRYEMDLEMQQLLLEDAEAEVAQMRLAWQIDSHSVRLLHRIDVSNPGAFGAVWAADWDGLMVAVKVLRTDVLNFDDEESVRGYDKEAEFFMKARHTNLVRFFGAGRMDDGSSFLVLELVSRGSLSSILRDHSFNLSEQTKHRLAQDVAHGMAYIHSLGAMHRDLKSGNVLVTEGWQAKIADFGSLRQLFMQRRKPVERGAKSHWRHSQDLDEDEGDTASGAGDNGDYLSMTAGVGTPLYMAPEVLRGQAYTSSADVWSFGVVLWELMHEQRPDLLEQEGDTGRRGPLMSRLSAQLDNGARLRVAPHVSQWARLAIESCMAATPSARPSFPMLIVAMGTKVEEVEEG